MSLVCINNGNIGNNPNNYFRIDLDDFIEEIGVNDMQVRDDDVMEIIYHEGLISVPVPGNLLHFALSILSELKEEGIPCSNMEILEIFLRVHEDNIVTGIEFLRRTRK